MAGVSIATDAGKRGNRGIIACGMIATMQGNASRDSLKCLYMVARIFCLLLLNCSAQPCLGPCLPKTYKPFSLPLYIFWCFQLAITHQSLGIGICVAVWNCHDVGVAVAVDKPCLHRKHLQIQRLAKGYANLAKQNPGRTRQNR